jgi:nucleoside-diphosphate-sugar epimerase
MKVIITGSTGMVGKGVLLECIDDPGVEKVLLINRNPIGMSHPKIEEVIHKDFSDFLAIKNQMNGYDVCYHCMGVSSVGMSESEFNKFTFELTKALASVLYSVQPNMVFFYVSGMGTDSSEKGKVMWARVKGKTENMILNMGFKDAYVFRPGAIIPERGIKSRTKLYNIFYILFRPFFPLMKRIKSVTTTSKVGRAMINLYRHPQVNKHIEGEDINRVALIG